MNALEIRGLKKEYDGFTLDIGELTLPSGCILGLIGENGAGKSTTIRLILDLIRPTAGEIAVLGHMHGELGAEKEQLGVVLDNGGVPGLTAREYGQVLARVYPAWDAEGYRSLLTRLDVPQDKPFDKLSQGMKQKLAIAAALSHNASLLILDEPTNGLDPVAREIVTELLMEFTRDAGHSVLISSHIVSDLEKICDYIAFLHRGRILLCEEKDALAAEYALLRCPAARLDELDQDAILMRRDTPYYSEAVVRRDGMPDSAELLPVGIEEIFVAMVKEDR